MSFSDFMAVHRKVMIEDQILAWRRQDEARSKAQQVAAWLKKKYGVERVYLFSSLAWGGFHIRSDIDLLVRGFKDKERYWQMQAGAAKVGSPFELNLICEEEAPVSLRNSNCSGYLL